MDLIICARGGYNSNQLLDKINWDIIRNNPKLFLGFSDITVLCNAIYQKTGIKTYNGCSFIDFGRDNIERLLHNTKCLLDHTPLNIDTKEATIINDGIAEGVCVGGNMSSFMLLKGTEYFPQTLNPILLLESDSYVQEGADRFFDRNLYSLLQDNQLESIQALLIGQFEDEDNITVNKIKEIIKNNDKLKHVPVISNINFTHKFPSEIFQIGGEIQISATNNEIKINFRK